MLYKTHSLTQKWLSGEALLFFFLTHSLLRARASQYHESASEVVQI